MRLARSEGALGEDFGVADATEEETQVACKRHHDVEVHFPVHVVHLHEKSQKDERLGGIWT